MILPAASLPPSRRPARTLAALAKSPGSPFPKLSTSFKQGRPHPRTSGRLAIARTGRRSEYWAPQTPPGPRAEENDTHHGNPALTRCWNGARSRTSAEVTVKQVMGTDRCCGVSDFMSGPHGWCRMEAGSDAAPKRAGRGCTSFAWKRRRLLSGRAGNSRPAGTVASTEGPAPRGRGSRRPRGRPPHQDPGPRIAVRPPRTRTKTYFCRRTVS